MTVRCSLGHENPDGSLFCDECGEPLAASAPVAAPAPATGAGTQVCPSCNTVNPAGESFCSNCGTPLSGSTPAAAAAPTLAEPAPAISAAPVAAAAPALTAPPACETDKQEFELTGKE